MLYLGTYKSLLILLKKKLIIINVKAQNT